MTAIPLEHPALSRQRLQQRLATLVERLIDALDSLDLEADFEPDGSDEPSLSFQEARSWDSQESVIRFSPIGGDQFIDLEEACEDEGAVTGDDEPELGQ